MNRLTKFKFFRSPRSKRCSSKTHCCRCLEKNKDLTKEEYRKYYNFFLTDNPNTECPKAGHAAYSDSVRTEVSRRINLNNVTYEPNFPDLSVSASNFMVIFYCKLRYRVPCSWHQKSNSPILEFKVVQNAFTIKDKAWNIFQSNT